MGKRPASDILDLDYLRKDCVKRATSTGKVVYLVEQRKQIFSVEADDFKPKRDTKIFFVAQPGKALESY